MTTLQRTKWNNRITSGVQRHLQTVFAILSHTSDRDNTEIQQRVMDRIHEDLQHVSDFQITNDSLLLPSDSVVDSMIMDILQEQELRRDMGMDSCW
jgi:hypothetical protein